MRESFEISIPKPCHEKWEKFKPTNLGGFCSSCQEEVIDFTTWDEDQIKSYFKNRSQTSCGRFYSSQLKSYSLDEPPKFNFAKWTFAPILSLIMMLSTQEANAQVKPSTKGELSSDKDHARRVLQPVRVDTVSGRVTATEDGAPLFGVNVVLNGTAYGTSTDVNGDFSLPIYNKKQSDSLVFSFIGLEPKEFAIGNQTVIDVSLALDAQQLNEIVVTAGGLTITRSELGNQTYSTKPKWRLRDLFRRR